MSPLFSIIIISLLSGFKSDWNRRNVMTAALDRAINAQVIYWKKQKEQLNEPEEESRLPFVTISREYGCGGYEVGEKLIEILNEEMKPEPLWIAYNQALLDKLMIDTGLSKSLIETLTMRARNTLTDIIQTTFSSFPPQVAVHKKLVEIMAMLALNGHVVLIGRGGNTITKNMKNGFHIRLVAPLNNRVERISKAMNISKNEATKLINEKSKYREGYMKEFFKIDLSDPHHYDMLINESVFSTDNTARLIIQGMKHKGVL
jgi:hypothetical protein